MTKFDDICEATADTRGMITSSEARALGISNNELVQFARMGKLQRLGQGLYRVEWYSHPTSASYALGRRLPRQAMSVPSQPVADSIRSCMGHVMPEHLGMVIRCIAGGEHGYLMTRAGSRTSSWGRCSLQAS